MRINMRWGRWPADSNKKAAFPKSGGCSFFVLGSEFNLFLSAGETEVKVQFHPHHAEWQMLTGKWNWFSLLFLWKTISHVCDDKRHVILSDVAISRTTAKCSEYYKMVIRLEGCGHYESLNDWRRLFWGTHQRECFVRLKKKLHRDIDFLISLVILLNLWGQQWWFIAAPLHFYSAVRRASNTICKVEFSNLFSHTCFLNTLTEKLLEIAIFATLSFCQSVKNA